MLGLEGVKGQDERVGTFTEILSQKSLEKLSKKRTKPLVLCLELLGRCKLPEGQEPCSVECWQATAARPLPFGGRLLQS